MLHTGPFKSDGLKCEESGNGVMKALLVSAAS